MIQFGSLTLLLSLICGIGAMYFYVHAYYQGSDKNANLDSLKQKYNYGTWLSTFQFIFILIACAILLNALLTSDFRLEYVAEYTSKNLETIFKFTAFWAGQSGSMLFWTLIICLYTLVEMRNSERYHPRFGSVVMAILTFASLFFTFVVLGVKNVFEIIPRESIPPDGFGLNPVLQHMGMTYHPPFLYLGYVSMTIPFAYSVAGLLTGDRDGAWIRSGRVWAVYGWLVLSIGIILGGYWAYTILGWGGYWAWDPVENASIFPWFAMTAYLHASFACERKKGRYIVWVHLLAVLSYLLVIFGTYLTRSGVIESVHAFGKSNLGIFFLGYMLLMVLYIPLIFKNKHLFLADEHTEIDVKSVDVQLIIGAMIIMAIDVAITFGTIVPILSQIFVGKQYSLDISFYNRVSIALSVFLLIAMGYTQIYVRGNKNTSKFFVASIIFGVLFAVFMYVIGFNQLVSTVLFLLLGLAAFSVLTSIVLLFTLGGTFYSKMRSFGAMLVHCGVVILLIGIVISSFYKTSDEGAISVGESLNVEGLYSAKLAKYDIKEKPLYDELIASINIYDNRTGANVYEATTTPSLKVYNGVERHLISVPSIYSTFKNDIYVTLTSADLDKNQYSVKIMILPYLSIVWIGSVILFLGGFVLLARTIWGRFREGDAKTTDYS